MTKRHFEAIAKVLNREYHWRKGEGLLTDPETLVEDIFTSLVGELSEEFSEFNENFDLQRFATAVYR